MNNADSRVGLVDVLTARTAGTVSGDFNVFLADDNSVKVFKLGHDLDGCKRCLTTTVCIKGRNAHQAVNTVLALEVAVSVQTGDHHSCTLNASTITVEPVGKLNVKAALFCPTGNHAVEHLRPVLRLGATCTGVEGNNGVALVILTGKEHLNAAAFFLGNNGIQLALDFFYKALVVLFNCHFCQSDGVLKTRTKTLIAGNFILTLLNGL